MSASKLEMSVERFNTALASLKESANKVKHAQPLTEQERSVAVAGENAGDGLAPARG